MKFLVIQENGRHEKNRNFRECFSTQRSLIALGHDCEVWGKNHVNMDKSIDFNNYDVIIDLENYDTGWIPNLSSVKVYKILWVIDGHCRGMQGYYKRFESGKYDLILQATKRLVDDKSIWFPNCFDNELIYPLDVEKKADVGFCGNKLNRQSFFDILNSNFNFKSDIFVIGDDMVKAVNSYRIHFNVNYNFDINYRSFETIGCKIPLVTNYDAQYNDLGFKDGTNCMMYKNTNELVSKIKFALENKEYLNEMSEQGFLLSEEHTYIKRMKYLEHIIKEGVGS